eukprot:863435-Rhodomonas_salina.3
MSPTFALSTLSHIEEALPSFFCGEDVGTVTATSGGEDGALGTFFAVFVQGTEIAKALVLYQSGDYDAEGPMLEHMEMGSVAMRGQAMLKLGVSSPTVHGNRFGSFRWWLRKRVYTENEFGLSKDLCGLDTESRILHLSDGIDDESGPYWVVRKEVSSLPQKVFGSSSCALTPATAATFSALDWNAACNCTCLLYTSPSPRDRG